MQYYSSQSQDYSAENEFEYGRRQSERAVRTRRSQTVRASRKSSGYGGIHRRRNKHWTW